MKDRVNPRARIRPLLVVMAVLALAALARQHGKNQIHPAASPTGAAFRFTPPGASSWPGQPGPGIKTITLHVDNGRANRLNARRDPNLLEARPRAFGPRAPFKPLICVDVAGPGNLEIQGDGPTGTIRTTIPEGGWGVEIYPEFLPEKLLGGRAGETETLKFYFEPATGGREKQAEETLSWSGPEEIFLRVANLIDLAALTKPVPRGPIQKEGTSPQQWLENLGKELKAKNLGYESEPAAQGWQAVRTEEKMDADGRANCLDIALMVARRAKQNGFSPHILANSGHALCAVGLPGQPPANATFFEGTAYLSETPKPKPTPPPSTAAVIQSVLTGKPVPPPAPTPPPPNTAAPREPEPPEIFAVDLGAWETFFRALPEKRDGKTGKPTRDNP